MITVCAVLTYVVKSYDQLAYAEWMGTFRSTGPKGFMSKGDNKKTGMHVL